MLSSGETSLAARPISRHSVTRPWSGLSWSTVAHHGPTHQYQHKLEAVQRWTARFATGDYRTTSSTSQLISRLGWESMQHRRTTARIVMMYRVRHHLIDIPVAMLSHPATLTTRGHNMRYIVPYCRTDVYRHSFVPAGIRLWNQLTECIVTPPTLDTFKGGLATLDA